MAAAGTARAGWEKDVARGGETTTTSCLMVFGWMAAGIDVFFQASFVRNSRFVKWDLKDPSVGHCKALVGSDSDSKDGVIKGHMSLLIEID